MKVSFFIVSIRHEWGHTNYGLRERLNGIQEVSGSIPLISTKSSEEARKTLKSLDFKVFSYPKVGNSLYSLFAPVRLIFDGNFENQEVRYYEEN